jgi:hypothetical protein
MDEEEKMAVVDIEVETRLHLSIDTWHIPANALIGKDLSESGLRIIKRNLEGQLIKVKSGARARALIRKCRCGMHRSSHEDKKLGCKRVGRGRPT